MDKKSQFNIGDDIFNPRRPAGMPERIAPEAFEEDTEGHAIQTHTFPAAVDDELDCRIPISAEEEERIRRL